MAAEEQMDQAEPSLASWILGWIPWIAGALIITVLVRAFVGEAYIIPTGSMLDTIQLDDRVWGEKLSYKFREPEQGEIIMFATPTGEDYTLVKRVIAVGGQTVDLVDGHVVVDGETLDEPYTGGKESWPLAEQLAGVGPLTYPYTVPEGHVWVMGDNRTNSRDSRYFGPVSVDAVQARAVFTFWPLSDVRWL